MRHVFSDRVPLNRVLPGQFEDFLRRLEAQ